MHARIIQTPPHIHQKHLDLGLLPPQAVHKGPLADGSQSFHEDHTQEPDALFALTAVFGPPANGQLVAHLSDVVEAVSAEEIWYSIDGVEVEAELGETELLVVAKVAEGVGRGRGEGCVVGLWPVYYFLEFEVAAWFEVSGGIIMVSILCTIGYSIG